MSTAEVETALTKVLVPYGVREVAVYGVEVGAGSFRGISIVGPHKGWDTSSNSN